MEKKPEYGVVIIGGYQYYDMGNDNYALVMTERCQPVKEDTSVRRWVKTGDDEFTLYQPLNGTYHQFGGAPQVAETKNKGIIIDIEEGDVVTSCDIDGYKNLGDYKVYREDGELWIYPRFSLKNALEEYNLYKI